MNKPKSNNLFHFTKNIDFLLSILGKGIYPRYCLEDTSWLGIDFHMAYPTVCFCDIPLSRISEHTEFYGAYGIGLSKDWGLKNNLSPVVYCADKGHVVDVANYLFRYEGPDDEAAEEKDAREIIFWKLAKLVKPLKGKMFIKGSFVEKEFYQESEWRFTPAEKIGETIILHEEFDKEKENKNKEVEQYKLQFSPSDIRYIFVKEDVDIPVVVDFINNNLGQYPLNDLKILNSRIVSLQTIESDL